MLPPVSAVTAGELSPQTPGQKPDAVASPANQPTTPQAISDTSPNIPVVAARAISGKPSFTAPEPCSQKFWVRFWEWTVWKEKTQEPM